MPVKNNDIRNFKAMTDEEKRKLYYKLKFEAEHSLPIRTELSKIFPNLYKVDEEKTENKITPPDETTEEPLRSPIYSFQNRFGQQIGASKNLSLAELGRLNLDISRSLATGKNSASVDYTSRSGSGFNLRYDGNMNNLVGAARFVKGDFSASANYDAMRKAGGLDVDLPSGYGFSISGASNPEEKYGTLGFYTPGGYSVDLTGSSYYDEDGNKQKEINASYNTPKGRSYNLNLSNDLIDAFYSDERNNTFGASYDKADRRVYLNTRLNIGNKRNRPPAQIPD